VGWPPYCAHGSTKKRFIFSVSGEVAATDMKGFFESIGFKISFGRKIAFCFLYVDCVVSHERLEVITLPNFIQFAIWFNDIKGGVFAVNEGEAPEWNRAPERYTF
jgi:hypothetical protein